MSIADLSREGSPSEDSSTRPKGISCPRYDALFGEKRCRHYLKGGACSRPDEFMCVEWLKANGQAAPPEVSSPTEAEPESKTSTAPATDLFGQVVSGPMSTGPRKNEQTTPTSCRSLPATQSESRLPLRGLTTQDIESFKALRVEVCLRSDSVDELWLVPDYTGRDRKEITPEHAATICHVLEAFPGSRVMSFEKTNNSTKENTE